MHRAWTELLEPHFPSDGRSCYATFTWADEYAGTRGIHGCKRAIGDVSAFLSDVGVLTHFVAVEFTDRCTLGRPRSDGSPGAPAGRPVPHVHGIIRLPLGMAREQVWSLWYSSRRSLGRFLPVTDGCHSYVTKYLLKDERADSIAWRFAA